MQNQSAIEITKSSSSNGYLYTSYNKLIENTISGFVQKSTYADQLDQEDIISEVKEGLSQRRGLSSKPESIIRLTVLDLCKQVCNNYEDLVLVNNKSPQLITKYQYQTLSIIKKFEFEELINPYEIDFLLEETNARLTEKLVKRAFSKYQKGVLFRTYFYKITENAVRDELRKKAVRIKTQELDASLYEKPHKRDNHQIELYAATFGNLLQILLTKADRRKFELCIKVIYRIVLDQSDIIKDYPFCSKQTLESLLDSFGKPYLNYSKGELWETLNENIGKLEGKTQSVRTLKDWVGRYKIKMIENILKKPVTPTTVEQKKAVDTFMELLVYHFYKKPDDVS